jgi:hypothetical protein
MWLYLAGAVMLALHLLGAAALHAKDWPKHAPHLATVAEEGEEDEGGGGAINASLLLFLPLAQISRAMAVRKAPPLLSHFIVY